MTIALPDDDGAHTTAGVPRIAEAAARGGALVLGPGLGRTPGVFEFVREKARPFFEAANGGWAQRASDDPHTIHRYGRLATRVRAAEALLRDAAATLDDVTRRPKDAQAAARGSIAVAQAKARLELAVAQVASAKQDYAAALANTREHSRRRRG